MNPYHWQSLIGNRKAGYSVDVKFRELFNEQSVNIEMRIDDDIIVNIYMDERGCPMLHFVSQAEDRYVCLDE